VTEALECVNNLPKVALRDALYKYSTTTTTTTTVHYDFVNFLLTPVINFMKLITTVMIHFIHFANAFMDDNFQSFDCIVAQLINFDSEFTQQRG